MSRDGSESSILKIVSITLGVTPISLQDCRSSALVIATPLLFRSQTVLKIDLAEGCTNKVSVILASSRHSL